MQKSIQSQDTMLWDMRDLTTQLKLGRNTVYTLMGKGLPVLRFGRALRFDPDEVKQWVKEYSRKAD